MTRTKTIAAEFGTITYRIGERRSDTALIFIHGAVGDSRLFRHQIKYFGNRYTTIALDLPGHGRSVSSRLPTMEQFIGAIMSVIREEGIGSAVLIGHSMGGGICLEICMRGTIPVRGLILVATAAVLPIPEHMLLMVENNEISRFSDYLVGMVFSRKTGLLVELARRGVPEMDVEMIRNDMRICRGMDYFGILQNLSMPVLIVANRGDRLISWNASAEMGPLIHDSRLVIFELDGHVPFFEYDEQFNPALDRFLSEIL